MQSVSLRLISSGMSRSWLRSPASTWMTRGRARGPPEVAKGAASVVFAVTSAQPMVEFTSPTTMTPCGCSFSTTGSNRFMISAVCCACDPLPTSSSMSGRGMRRSSKKTFDIAAS